MKAEIETIQRQAGDESPTKDIRDAFRLLEITEEDTPPYAEPELFARQFKRCDLMEYAHTRYSVTSAVEE